MILLMIASLLSGVGVGWAACMWWGRDRRPAWAQPLHSDAICGRCGARRGGHYGYARNCPTVQAGFFRPMSLEQRFAWEQGEDMFKPQVRA